MSRTTKQPQGDEVYIAKETSKIYEIDFSKVKTVDDIKKIIKVLDIRFTGNKVIKEIEYLVKEVM